MFLEGNMDRNSKKKLACPNCGESELQFVEKTKSIHIKKPIIIILSCMLAFISFICLIPITLTPFENAGISKPIYETLCITCMLLPIAILINGIITFICFPYVNESSTYFICEKCGESNSIKYLNRDK